MRSRISSRVVRAIRQARKKGVHDRFSLSNDQFEIDASRMRIPNPGGRAHARDAALHRQDHVGHGQPCG